MTHVPPAQELNRDELRLLRMFRLLGDSERDELMVRTGELAASRYSVRNWHRISNQQDALEREAREGLDTRLGSAIPPMEPWDTLGDYFSCFMREDGDEWSQPVFGADAFLDVVAENLLNQVEQVYMEAEGPYALEPWEDEDGESPFSAEDMKAFVVAWQDLVLSNMERKVVLPPVASSEGSHL